MCVFMCEFMCMFLCLFMCVFVFVCINAGMPDCLASDQYVTVIIKTNKAGTDPVPDQADALRHFFGQVLD